MGVSRAVKALFDVREGEGRATAFAFLALLGVTAAHTLIETARDALFLARIPATHLPALYITIAVVGVITTRVSAAFGARATSTATADAAPAKKRFDPVAISMMAAAIITAGFWALAASPTPYVLYALYVFTGMFAGWVAGQLWLRFGALFTVAQAKRLYGAIGTGAVLGAVLGSAIARAALAIIEVRHLLIAATAILVITALGPAGLLPTPKPRVRARALRAGDGDDDSDNDSNGDGATGLGAEIQRVARHPYLVRLLLLTLFAACAGTAIDFLFKREIARSYSPAELGPLIATVSLATNIASLLAQAIGVGVVVRVLGVHRALYVMPILIALGAGSALLGGALYAILALRGADGALRYSLHKTSSELLFVPLPDKVRSRAKPIIDLVGQRGGQALISVAILAVTSLVATDHNGGKGDERVGFIIAGAVLAIALAWLVLAWTIRPRYLDVFRDTLRRGGRVDLGESSRLLPELDMAALEALIAALSSRRDAEVLGALDLLAAQRRGRLIPSLVLYHPSKPIVLRALELLVDEGRTDFLDVADRLLEHADPEVRAAALRARASVDPDPTFLRERLASPHDELRATALVALIASEGKLITPDEGRAAFAEMIASGDVAARRALARALAETPHSNDPLLEEIARTLIADPDTETRRLAAAAMGSLCNPAFGPVLVEFLGDRAAGVAGVEALGAMGDKVIKLLDATLDRPDIAPEIKWRVVAALARSTSDEAVRILMRRVTKTETDTGMRSRMLRALRTKQSAGVAITIPQGELLRLAEGTIAAVARALSFRLTHAKLLEDHTTTENGKTKATAGAELLQSLLRDKEVEGVDRLFLVLSLLYPNERFPSIQRGIENPDAKARASARELLENILDASIRARVLAVVDDLDDAARLALIDDDDVVESSPRDQTSYEELIHSMIRHGSELGALAAFHASEIGMSRESMREAISEMDASAAALARDLSAKDLSAVAV